MKLRISIIAMMAVWTMWNGPALSSADEYRILFAYRITYYFPEAHRTSNMIDRLMQRMDRHLFSTQYFMDQWLQQS